MKAIVVLLLSASSAGSVLVRDLRGAGDLFATASLLRATFAPSSNPISSTAIVAEHVVGLRERGSANIQLVACREDNSIVGFVEVYTPEFLASTAGDAYPERVRSKLKPYVASLAVASDVRRRGFGRALMEAAEQRVVARGGPLVLSLEVEEGDVPASALYSSLGYSLVSRDVNGRRLDGDIFFGSSVPVTKLAYEKVLSGVIRVGTSTCGA